MEENFEAVLKKVILPEDFEEVKAELISKSLSFFLHIQLKIISSFL